MSLDDGRHTNECDRCSGRGIVDAYYVGQGGGYVREDDRDMLCPQCKGKGFIVEDEKGEEDV